MKNVLAFLFSFAFPGLGQMARGRWAVGFGFFAYVLTCPLICGLSKVVSNDGYVALVVGGFVLNAMIRLWSAVHAARLRPVARNAVGSRAARLGIILLCVLVYLFSYSFEVERRMRAFKVSNGTMVHAPELAVGTRVLAVGREHFEGPLEKGDYVLIRLPKGEGQQTLQSVFRVAVLPGDKAPQRPSAAGEGVTGGDQLEPLAPAHYLLQSCTHEDAQVIVGIGAISAKLVYVIWPLNRIAKL